MVMDARAAQIVRVKSLALTRHGFPGLFMRMFEMVLDFLFLQDAVQHTHSDLKSQVPLRCIQDVFG